MASCASSVALAECRAIWGPSAKIDLLLSLGTGSWPSAAKGPDWLPQTPEGLVEQLWTAIKSVDGEEAWDRFLSTEAAGVEGKFSRLSPRFNNCHDLEPELDATGRIGEIKSMTENYVFPLPSGDKLHESFSSQPSDSLSALADLLRASLFYLHVDNAARAQTRGDVKIKGFIRCRLALPDQQEAFEKLLAMTTYFHVTDKSGYRQFRPSLTGKWLNAGVEITGELGTGVMKARIEAEFKGGQRVAISGFPSTAAVRPIFVGAIVLRTQRLNSDVHNLVGLVSAIARVGTLVDVCSREG